MGASRSLLLLGLLTMLCKNYIAETGTMEVCFGPAASYKCRLSTMTPYRYIGNLEDSKIEYNGCTAKKLWLMIRHGTRYPGKKWINTLISDLPKIRDSITEAHKQGKGSLRLEEAQNLLNWKITFGLKDMMNLAREGGRELVGIAERFQSRLPGVLPEIYNNETYSFKFTPTQRAEESAKSFSLGLFGAKQTKNVWYPKPDYRDLVLRFYKGCPRWREQIDKNPEAYVESKKFIISTAMNETIAEVSQRLGIKVNYDTVKLIYMICAFETAWHETTDSPWCSVFSMENFKVLEFSKDLEYYWIDGYGYSLTYEQACTAMRDMFNFFESPEPVKTKAYFTHSGTILKLLALLGIAKDSKPLRHDSFLSLGDSRAWRTSLIDAFGSNMAFVYYECETQGPSILFMHQERVVKLPGCPENLPCPLSTMKDKYPDEESECPFDEMCATI